MILVDRSAVEPSQNVFPGEDREHAGNRERPLAIDAYDARVRVGRPQHFEMGEPVERYVHGVAGVSGDDLLAKWIGQARAAGFARGILFDRSDAAQRINDRAVSGAPAQIALERMWEVGALYWSKEAAVMIMPAAQ